MAFFACQPVFTEKHWNFSNYAGWNRSIVGKFKRINVKFLHFPHIVRTSEHHVFSKNSLLLNWQSPDMCNFIWDFRRSLQPLTGKHRTATEQLPQPSLQSGLIWPWDQSLITNNPRLWAEQGPCCWSPTLNSIYLRSWETLNLLSCHKSIWETDIHWGSYWTC